MVAIVSSRHVFHEPAIHAVGQRIRKKERMFLAAHSLVEAFSVLTRIPPPGRVPPEEAWELIRENFIERARVVSLEPREYISLLRSLPAAGIAGGRSFDAVIAACARKAGAAALLTFNPKDFLPFGDETLEIVLPE